MQPVATHELELVSGGGGKHHSTKNVYLNFQVITVNQLAFNIGSYKSSAVNTSVIYASN